MFWIRFLIISVVMLAVLVAGVLLFGVNSDPVTVNYMLGSAEWRLSLVVVWAFTVGAVVAVVIGFFAVMPLRLRLLRLQGLVDSQQQEISTLLKKTGQEFR